MEVQLSFYEVIGLRDQVNQQWQMYFVCEGNKLVKILMKFFGRPRMKIISYTRVFF